MSDTAKLLTAVSSTAIHAFKPDESNTLCGLSVVEPDSWDGKPPQRSADIIYKELDNRPRPVRFYTGVHRLMCMRCIDKAPYARMDPDAVVIQLSEWTGTG